MSPHEQDWQRFLDWLRETAPGPYAAWGESARLVESAGGLTVYVLGRAGPRFLARQFGSTAERFVGQRLRWESAGPYPMPAARSVAA